MRYAVPLALTLLALAGCTTSPAPVVRPAPIVAPPPVRLPPAPLPLASDWNDWPFTPGQWRYVQRPEITQAQFDTDADVVSISCNRAGRQVELTGILPGPVTIRTTTMTRTVAPTGNFRSDQPAMGVSFAASDPLLDAITFSRGRFVIEQAGRRPAVLPPHAEIGRVIEDCRG
ncbi:MAG: hypothetical protein E7773_02405 [Sphingomonas sp.]|uniref:hypothetical protein n=1 Tax=Sphingomonas sp. TaxID=28214 RepID=UPI0011FDBE5F|nr:hypothetical protein [Sphingomonas sp.]THD37851.1 MAG: hypothetical protein E7773_02405 [Sphingomonas sp.]